MANSVYDEINRLETAKSDIETAIETCGVNVPKSELISAYASYIRQIPSAVFSELNTNLVGGENMFVKTIQQTNGLINVTTGGLVSASSSGLTPKIETSLDSIIKTQADEWVLVSTKGEIPTWRKLPGNAFVNTNTTYSLSGILNDNEYVVTLTDSNSNKTYATVPVMTGATTSTLGKAGLVPGSTSNDYNKFLKGDGTWSDVINASSINSPVYTGNIIGLYHKGNIDLNKPLKNYISSVTPSYVLRYTADSSSNPTTNIPVGCNDGNLLHVQGSNSDTAFQLTAGWTNDALYFRSGNEVDGIDNNTGEEASQGLYKNTWRQIAFKPDVVESLGISNNQLTWTKNGTTNSITIPYSTNTSNVISSEFSSSNSHGLETGLAWSRAASTVSGGIGTAIDSNGFNVSNNANGILWLGTHPKSNGVYGGQLGVSSNSNLYYRYILNGSFPNTWDKITFMRDLISSNILLTGYSSTTTDFSNLTTTDTVSSALRKLECKTQFVYSWLTSEENDADKKINKWKEVEKFLEGIEETTLNSILSTKADKSEVFRPFRFITSNNITGGYYKIKINSSEDWMLAFNVRIYQSYVYSDIRFSGYNYKSQNQYWYNPKAVLIDGDVNVTVIFGYDDDKTLWVAIPRTSYTGIEITNVTNGFKEHTFGNDFSKLFTITSVNSVEELGTTQTTQNLVPLQTQINTKVYDLKVEGDYLKWSKNGETYNSLEIPYSKKSSQIYINNSDASSIFPLVFTNIDTRNGVGYNALYVNKTSGIGFNPYTNSIHATKFEGTATRANYIVSQGRKDMITGTTKPEYSGISMIEAYGTNTGYPVTYGNIIQVKGISSSGAGQLCLGWTSTNTIGNVYYRSLRDQNNEWSDWKQLAFTTSTVSAAEKLSNPRKIEISGGAIGTDTYFDGSANISIPVTKINESYIEWGGKNISGGVSAIDMATSELHNANRLAFGNPNGITVDYSTDGTNWNNYELTDKQKIELVSGIGCSCHVGKRANGNSTNDKVRVTLHATNMGIYTRPKKLLLFVNTNGATGCYVTLEYSKKGSPDTFITCDTYPISGMTGWNSIPIPSNRTTFGGYDNQNDNCEVFRLTFGISGTTTNSSGVVTGGLYINQIILLGETSWKFPSNYSRNGHMYSYDAYKNVTFPSGINSTAILTTTLTATNYIGIKWSHIGEKPTTLSGYGITDAVTLNTGQTVTGLKTFESNSSGTGISLILKNKGWTGGMSTALDFYTGGSKTVPSARIEDYMISGGAGGGCLRFSTQSKSETNPNPNALVERMRIDDQGVVKIISELTSPKININGANSNAFISSNSSTNMYFNVNNRIIAIRGNDRTSSDTEGPALRPGSNFNDTFYLGTSAVRWANVYSVLGNFSGAVNAGSVTASGDITAYSDRRLKSNIQTLENRGYIEPVTFEKDGKKCIGFIAQDVEEKYPELVNSDGEYLSLNYQQYTAVLQAQIIELEKRIKQLENGIIKH